ncbi:MAG TPA: hypothetical protein VK181_09745 [Rhizobium sp.]|nr:hypothetical protein [Rhizobium sp.]
MSDNRTPAEIAGHKLIDNIAELRGTGFIASDSPLATLADELEDALVRQEAARIDTPKIAEVTGNISETELAARYMEAKALGARAFAERIPRLTEAYDIVAQAFTAAAGDFRTGLHLPSIMIEGKVIPYNEDSSAGIKHADALRTFFTDVHQRNVQAGWWHDLYTGEPKKRSVGELFMLFVTEIAEAYDAWYENLNDDKLPHHSGLGVELGDLGIRWADFCGALLSGKIVEFSDARNPGDAMFAEVRAIANRYEAIRKTPEALGDAETGEFISVADVAVMIDEKLAYNAQRADHKIENRLADGGKKT